MPRYRFQWENVPSDLVNKIVAHLSLPASSLEGIKSRYGMRPKVDFIQDTWKLLFNEWLVHDVEALASVASNLRSLGLGDTQIQPDLQYVESCRNTIRLREVVLDRFLALGEQVQAVESLHAAASTDQAIDDQPGFSDQQSPALASTDQMFQQLLRLKASTAIAWLKHKVAESLEEYSPIDQYLELLINGAWSSEGEFLGFFRDISVHIAGTACEDSGEATATLFERDISDDLSLGSPYSALWEKALLTKSGLLEEEINLRDEEGFSDIFAESIPVIGLIPLAFAHERALHNQILHGGLGRISPVTELQEQFLSAFADYSGNGYFDGPYADVEMAAMPSSRVLAQMLEDCHSHQQLWKPDILEMILGSEFCDIEVRNNIQRGLSGESARRDGCEPEWQEHLDTYWPMGTKDEILAKLVE